MARVIGDKPVGAFKRTCKGCHYEIEFSPSDIHKGNDPDDNTSYKYVICPRKECRKSLDLLQEERERDRSDHDL